MITFKAIIIPGNRRKDGTYPVNIRVTFKGKSRRLATTLVCTAADLTRSLKIKNPTILNKSDALIAKMRTEASGISPFDLEDHDVDWVVNRIKSGLAEKSFRLDFFTWADTFIMSKDKSTRKTYSVALNAFERYLGKREIDINDITRPLLHEFVDTFDSQKKVWYNRHTGEKRISSKDKVSKGSSTTYIVKLEHIFKAAKDRYNDEDSGQILIPKSPFDKIPKTYPLHKGQRNLGRELMQRIISAEEENPLIRTALDAFIVSFGLMGANVADLYYAGKVENEWVYNRLKTVNRRSDHAEMRVKIQPELRPFLDRLKGTGDRWLNLQEYSGSKDSCTAKINHYLKRWCEKEGVPVFTFYAARHTWASLARAAGVDKSTVDDCLVHRGSFQVTDIYAERAWNVMQDANRVVFDLFKW